MATKQEYVDKASIIVVQRANALGFQGKSIENLGQEIQEMAMILANLSGETQMFVVDTLATEPAKQEPAIDPTKAITAKSIVCVECGKHYKLLTAKHMASHGLTPTEYRHKWGYKPGTPLCCRDLKKMRSEKMKTMKLWETRGAAKPSSKDAISAPAAEALFIE